MCACVCVCVHACVIPNLLIFHVSVLFIAERPPVLPTPHEKPTQTKCSQSGADCLSFNSTLFFSTVKRKTSVGDTLRSSVLCYTATPVWLGPYTTTFYSMPCCLEICQNCPVTSVCDTQRAYADICVSHSADSPSEKAYPLRMCVYI